MSLTVSGFPRYYYDFKNGKRYPILRRNPSILSSTLAIPAEQAGGGLTFPTGDLTNSRDLVFEFPTVIPRAYFLDGNEVPEADPPGIALPGSGTTNPAPAIVYAGLTILDTSSDQPVIENQLAIDNLIDAFTRNWELPRPYYLPTSKEWQVKGFNTHPTTPVQITITLRGALLELGDAEPYKGPED